MRLFHRSSIHPAVVAAIVALLLGGLLYGDVLSLPLFSDDLVQIPWLESISWRDLWTNPSPYGYYRPLWYTIWRVWGRLAGGLRPPGLHLLNLVAHIAAAWLTGLLAANWPRPAASRKERAIASGLASAFFVVFPFSCQAVAWPGAVYNPMVSGMGAAAVLAYDRGRRGTAARSIGVALLLAALAPFCYESGLLVALLLSLVELIGWLRGRWRTPSWWSLAFASLFLITLTLWRAMRGAGVVSFGLTPVDLWRNTAYLMQGLAYPLAPLAQRLVDWTAVDPVLALWLVALPTGALLTWRAIRRNLDVFLLGLAWFALFAVPPLVSMKAEWFALAPRFLYMTAAGVSLIWSGALSTWMAGRRSWQRLALSALAVGALLTPAAVFVRRGMSLYQMVGESIWHAAAAATREQPVLLVNLPRRITPSGRIHPLGFEGVTPLPQRVTADELAYVHAGIRDAAEAVAFGVVATDQPTGYSYQLFGRVVGWEEMADAARQARRVFLTRYEAQRIHLIAAGAVEGSSLPAEPVACFGDQVELLDASSWCDPTGRVHLTTGWRIQSPVDTDVSVFAHLLRTDGMVVAQADGRALLGMLPLWLWEPGETVRDVRHFDAVPGGAYTVHLGMWEPASGNRWQAAGYPDGVVTSKIRCP
jgi:hypothetical protein